MARPTWHLPLNSKTMIVVASAALVLVVGVGGVLFFNWLRDPHRVATAKKASASSPGTLPGRST